MVCKELTYVSSAKQQNEWKTIVNEFLTEEDYETFCKLYENVYAHLPQMVVTKLFSCAIGWLNLRVFK